MQSHAHAANAADGPTAALPAERVAYLGLKRCVIEKQVAVYDPAITRLISTRQRRLESGETPPPPLPAYPVHAHKTVCWLFSAEHNSLSASKNSAFYSLRRGGVLRSELQLRVVAPW